MSQVIKFNKLVRDKIPDIVQNEGNIVDYKILNPKYTPLELKGYIYDKLKEEATEVIEANDHSSITYELADLLAVMQKLAEVESIPWNKVIECMEEKKEKAGGFDRNIILKEITYKNI